MWRSAPDMVRSVLSKYQRECLLQEEGSRQEEKRQSLEDAAWRLVCKLPHANKFVCKPVEAVLRRALEDGASFEPLQAATAFAALEEYATNLILQPWRTELLQIKLYSGYYKHTVERYLKNAEAVLQLMGYEKREGSVLYLADAVDTATLGDVALDCLIAAAECRVLAAIMDGIRDRGLSLSWKEIYRFRRECSCDPEDAVRGLVQKHKYKSSKQPAPVFGANEPCVSWRDLPVSDYQMPSNGTWPSPHWQSYVGASAPDTSDAKRRTASSYRASMHAARHPEELVMGNADVLGNAIGDGDSYADAYGVSAVPWSGYCTATGYDLPGAVSRAGDRSFQHCSLAGEQCYTVPADSMPGRLPRHSGDCSSSRDAIGHLSQDFRSLSLGPKLSGLEMNGIPHEPALAMANAGLPPHPDSAGDCLDAAAVVEASQRYLEAEEAASDKQIWSCGACTYLNAPERDVCEMCSKSKHLGPEMTPLLSGGKQCPLCTLVNDRQALSCSACSQSLKDSPTYI